MGATLKITAAYPTPEDFLHDVDTELAMGGLFVRDVKLEGATAMAECTLEVRVTGHPPVSVPSRVAMVDESGVAVLFEGPPQPLLNFAEKLRRGDEGHQTAAERMKALTPAQKMQHALNADREERFALMRDPNKSVHIFVLKNPRTGSDEALTAAKMTTLSPDALKYISEHPEWGNSSAVALALVRNPHTPVPIAVKLLDKISAADVKMIAKTQSARGPIVQAARKKIHE